MGIKLYILVYVSVTEVEKNIYILRKQPLKICIVIEIFRRKEIMCNNKIRQIRYKNKPLCENLQNIDGKKSVNYGTCCFWENSL